MRDADNAIRILKVWGPQRTQAIGRELTAQGSSAELRRKLRSEIAASAGMPLDDTSATSRFHPPPRQPER